MVETERAGDEPEAAERTYGDDEPQVPWWAFALIFVGPAVVLSLAAAVVQWWEALASSPFTIALVVGHLVSAAALAGAYVYFYRRRA